MPELAHGLSQMARGTKPRGRPPKPEADRLSEVLNFRVTKAEADTVYRYAVRCGRPLNAILRAVLRGYFARPDR